MSNLRIGGLASGIDIDSIVEDLMTAERAPLNRLEQEKQILEWQQEDYRELNSTLFDFRSEVFNLKLQSTFNAKSATSSDEDVLEVTATANAKNGVYVVTVHNLATGVSKGSISVLNDVEDTEGNTKTLFEHFTEFSARGYSAEDEITVTINGTELTFDLDVDTIYTVASAINSANLGVSASYDSNFNRFFLTTTSTGSDAKITISSDDANFLSSDVSHDSILKLDINEGDIYSGEDASFNLGDAANLESSTNNVTINGLRLNLKDTGTSTVTVGSDTDAIFNTIQEFVSAYNEIMDTFYGKINEARYRDYPPLTDAQKEEMTEREIELWEERARSGLLRNDRQLSSLVSNLRLAMSRIVAGVGGSYSTLSEIGITTRSWNDNGHLYIDEDTLREALNQDPEGVKELFTNSSETNDEENGIAVWLYNAVNNGINYLTDKAGRDSSLSLVDNSYIGQRLRNLNDEIDEWEERLIEIEDRYWRQFTIMEQAINQMNAQSAWLAQQFGSRSW